MGLATLPEPSKTASKAEVTRVAQLPPEIASVAELAGDISIARCKSGSEDRIAEWLADQGIGWYSPQEIFLQRIRNRTTGKIRYRTRSRAFIPGVLFVANSWDGRYACQAYGREFSNQLYGWIGPVYTGALGDLLKRDLLRIERLLQIDPSLTSYHGIVPGARARVVSGPFEGLEGVIVRDGGKNTFYVVLRVLGQSVEVNVDAELLESIQ